MVKLSPESVQNRPPGITFFQFDCMIDLNQEYDRIKQNAFAFSLTWGFRSRILSFKKPEKKKLKNTICSKTLVRKPAGQTIRDHIIPIWLQDLSDSGRCSHQERPVLLSVSRRGKEKINTVVLQSAYQNTFIPHAYNINFIQHIYTTRQYNTQIRKLGGEEKLALIEVIKGDTYIWIGEDLVFN